MCLPYNKKIVSMCVLNRLESSIVMGVILERIIECKKEEDISTRVNIRKYYPRLLKKENQSR